MENELLTGAASAVVTFLGTWASLIRNLADTVRGLATEQRRLQDAVVACDKECKSLREELGSIRKQIEAQHLQVIPECRERLRDLELRERETVTRGELSDLVESQGKTLEKLIEKLGVVTGRLDALGLQKRS